MNWLKREAKYGQLYLRDLSSVIQEQFATEIRKNRPDLVAALDPEAEGDIIVGDFYKTEDFQAS